VTLGALAVLLLWILYSQFFNEPHFFGLEGKRVNVTVFYEVLCPDSRSFILRQLYPTWEKVPEIMDLNYRPFGKAHFTKHGKEYSFSCQHGPLECQGNILHNCAIKYVQQPLPYIKCMMENMMEPFKIGKQCAEMLDINWDVIEKCANGAEGQELLAKVGSESLGVKHKLSFIPTIAINGNFGDQETRLKNFLSSVCRSYNGPRPDNCIEVI